MAEKVAVAPHPARPTLAGEVSAGMPHPGRPASEGAVAAGTPRPAQLASEGAATPQQGLAAMGKVAARVLVHPDRHFAGVEDMRAADEMGSLLYPFSSVFSIVDLGGW
jgi:hypothetical protein